MATLTSVITQNDPQQSLSVVFNDPGQIDYGLYNSSGMSYISQPSFTLSKSDALLYFKYKQQFYSNVLANFQIVHSYFIVPLPVCEFDLSRSIQHSTIQYTQNTQESPSYTVKNWTYNTGTKQFTAAARLKNVTISIEEWLVGFQWMTQFFNQISLAL